VTTTRTDKMIRRVCMQHPRWSAKEIADTTSVRTIQRRLHDNFGLKACRPAKKNFCPRITAKTGWLSVGNIVTGHLKCGVESYFLSRVNFSSLNVFPNIFANHQTLASIVGTLCLQSAIPPLSWPGDASLDSDLKICGSYHKILQ
jgi:hypothetical protein